MTHFFDDNLYFNVTALSRDITVIAESHFSLLDLTPSDAMLLLVVSNKPGVQPTEISDKIKLAPSTITRMVEKLEKKDLLYRISEGKYTFIQATEKAKALFPAISETWLNVYKHFDNQLDTLTVEKLISDISHARKRITKK